MLKIISGGQTGVDRAALDMALASDLNVGGWCPKGRLAEDGKIPASYPLKETDSRMYQERTRLNVADSDGTLIFYIQKMHGGTALTARFARELQKPLLKIDLTDLFDPPDISSWLEENNIKILNIAGPRESHQPGIYDQTCIFLETLFLELGTARVT
jgi:hypothetical protein